MEMMLMQSFFLWHFSKLRLFSDGIKRDKRFKSCNNPLSCFWILAWVEGSIKAGKYCSLASLPNIGLWVMFWWCGCGWRDCAAEMRHASSKWLLEEKFAKYFPNCLCLCLCLLYSSRGKTHLKQAIVGGEICHTTPTLLGWRWVGEKYCQSVAMFRL